MISALFHVFYLLMCVLNAGNCQTKSNELLYEWIKINSAKRINSFVNKIFTWTPWWKIELVSARIFFRNQIQHRQTISIEESESTKRCVFVLYKYLSYNRHRLSGLIGAMCCLMLLFSKINMNGWESLFFIQTKNIRSIFKERGIDDALIYGTKSKRATF